MEKDSGTNRIAKKIPRWITTESTIIGLHLISIKVFECSRVNAAAITKLSRHSIKNEFKKSGSMSALIEQLAKRNTAALSKNKS